MTPVVPVPTKRCTRCGETKPLSDFYTRSLRRGSWPRVAKVVPWSHCKACEIARTTAAAKARRSA